MRSILLHKKKSMAKLQPNYFQLASDLLRGEWLLADAPSYLPLVLKFLDRQAVAVPSLEVAPRFYVDSGREVTGAHPASSGEKTVAVIPLHGSLTKYDTCSTYGTSYFAEHLKKLASRDDVVAVVLDIDSGGGACNAVAPMVEAIKAVKSSGKPVLAHCDFCASAAYWIASYCDFLYMDNSLSEVGSIGALVRLVDDRGPDPSTGYRIIEVYARESTEKNKAYRDALDGDYKAMEEHLSVLVGHFQKSVRENRPAIDTSAHGVMSGACFYPDEAIRLGMADGIQSLASVIEIAFAISEN